MGTMIVLGDLKLAMYAVYPYGIKKSLVHWVESRGISRIIAFLIQLLLGEKVLG